MEGKQNKTKNVRRPIFLVTERGLQNPVELIEAISQLLLDTFRLRIVSMSSLFNVNFLFLIYNPEGIPTSFVFFQIKAEFHSGSTSHTGLLSFQ